MTRAGERQPRPAPPPGGAHLRLLRRRHRVHDHPAAAAVLRGAAAGHARDGRPADRVVLHRAAAVGAALGTGVGPLRPPPRAAHRAGRVGGGVRRVRLRRLGVAAASPRGIVQGAGGGTTGVAQAYVADTVEPKDRARALGWLSSATAAGVILGPAIGSFAFHLGPAAPGIVAAALCLVNVVIAWKWLPESRRRPAAAASARKPIWHPAWLVDPAPDATWSRGSSGSTASAWSPSRR